MTLPTSAGGRTTEEARYFETDPTTLADWLQNGLDGHWELRQTELSTLNEAVAVLEPAARLSRYLCVPVGSWTVLLNNSPLGTDVGVLPSLAARELGCRAIRVVSVADDATYPARILEVYGPDGEPPLALVRSIVTANDGGRWVFETSGAPFSFENQLAYDHRLKARRLTVGMITDYLHALGVPVDCPPNWGASYVVEHRP